MQITSYQQFWALWTQHQDALQAYLLKKTKDSSLSEDLLQEIILKTHRACCSGRDIQNPRSWLFQIAHNAAVDHFKQQQKDQKISSCVQADNSSDIYQDLAFYLEALIQFLPPKYARPLEMADIQGMKQQEIADQLGLSLSATKSRIQRARVLLKKEIACCFELTESQKSGLLDFELKANCQSLKKFEKEKQQDLASF